MATTEKKPAEVVYMLPAGLVLVENLFERDVYKDQKTGAEGKPRYKLLLGFNPADVTGEGTIEDKMADAIEAAYGVDVANEWLEGEKKQPSRIRPMKDGDAYAADREARGKAADAFKGKLLISAETIWNKDGIEGPGGVSVYAPDTSAVTILQQQADNPGHVYPGCFGIAAVTFHTYEDYPRKGDRGLKCYLKAFQKTADGKKLVTPSDHSKLFQPVAGAPGTAEAGTRRRRAG